MNKKLNVMFVLACLVVLLMSGCDEKPVEPVNNEGRCDFNDISLPSNAVVYAVGVSTGKYLIWQIDDESPRESTQVEVFINEPGKPVILMLIGSQVDAWQIWRTPETRISAVYVGNAGPNPKVLGLSEFVPIVTTTGWSRGQCETIHYQFSYRDDEMKGLDLVAMQLLGKPVTQKFIDPSSERLYVGQQLPDTAYIQDRTQPTESLRIPNTPLVAQAGLDEALANETIRLMTQEELREWYDQYPAFFRHWSRKLPPDGRIEPIVPVYMILKSFQIPAGLSGTKAVVYVLPEGVPMPTGDVGNSMLFDVGADECFRGELTSGLKCFVD